MTARRLPPDGLPDWPRGLTEDLAAAYVGVGVETFRLEVKAGTWPKPRRAGTKGGLNVWDRHAIDAAYDRLSNPSSGGKQEALRRARGDAPHDNTVPA